MDAQRKSGSGGGGVRVTNPLTAGDVCHAQLQQGAERSHGEASDALVRRAGAPLGTVEGRDDDRDPGAGGLEDALNERRDDGS
jgi:hypothetical protein